MVELNFRVLKYLEGPLVVKSLITNPKLSSTIFFAKETGKYWLVLDICKFPIGITSIKDSFKLFVAHHFAISKTSSSLKFFSKTTFIFILIPLFSCSNIDFLNKEDLNIAIDEIEIIEKVEFIEENNLNNNLTYYDFYNRNNNYKWKLSTKLEKIYDISIGKKSELIFSAHSNIILIGQYAYYR